MGTVGSDGRKGMKMVGAVALAAGLVAGGYGISSAATGSGSGGGSTPSSSPAPGQGAFRSNEDPAHEQAEGAAREAAENNGTATHGHCDHGFRGGSNEDPAHEQGEGAAREAQENGTAMPQPPQQGPSTTPDGSSGSGATNQ